MSQIRITPPELDSTLKDIMNAFQQDAMLVAEDVARDVAEQTAHTLQAVSPKGNSRRRHYAKGWRAKRLTAGRGKRYYGYVVYNATKPGLAHLLEYGHNGARANGTAYFVNPQPHIKRVEEQATAEYVRRLRERLEHM